MSTRTDAGAPLCGTCRNRVRSAARTAELHAAAAALIGGWLGEVDQALVQCAVTTAAPNLRQAEWLTTALDDGPAVLAGSTTAAPVIDRLVDQLVAGGVVGIAPPCCVRCGRSAWLSQRLDGHRACQPCAMSARGERCSGCGKVHPVTTRTADGEPVCSACYTKDRTRWEACARCGNVRAITHRLDDGTGLCSGCGRRVAVCSMCGRERPCDGIRNGTPRCDRCAARRAPCSWCGRTARVSVVWATGPVCSHCRHKGLAAQVTCAGCGQVRRPDPRHPSGRCADCVGLARFSVCSDCGTEDRRCRAGRCGACLVPVVFDTLTDGPVDLSALRSTLAASDRPRSVLRWIERPFVTDALGRLASGELALTHQALDELGDNLAVIRLRGVLVQAGLLTERDEALARLEGWIAALVADIDDPDDRRTIDAFATWHVLRRARRRAEHARTTNTTAARTQIRRAIEFLAHLREHGPTLAECTQADLELWLSGPPSRRRVADFVNWAQRHRLCTDLRVPRRDRSWPAREITEHDLRDLVTRLLDDTELRLADRVAGLFVVCYGQLPARIARLRIDDTTTDAEQVAVRFGRDDIVLPPRIGALVSELATERRGRAATEPGATSPWLFPGGIPGQPLDPETLRQRLTAIGIANMRVRTATLLDLATHIPATVLADLVGLDPSTAARWSRAAGGDWTTYAAIRATPRTSAPSADDVIIIR